MRSAIPLADFRAFVLNMYTATQKKPATTSRIRQMLDELEATLGDDATTDNLTTAGMIQWLAKHGPSRAPQTIIGHLSNMRTLCSIALEEGWLERPPSWKRLRPKVRSIDEQKHHSRAEIAVLLDYLRARAVDWLGRRLYAAVATAVYTGVRRDELLFLRIADVDLAGGIISVVPLPDRDLKTPASERPVPIAPELVPILVGWIPYAGPNALFPGVKRRGAWHGGKVGRRPVDELRAACLACGIAPGTWQWMRRAWATHAESGWLLPDGAIERVLGHTKPATSKRWYRRKDLDNLRAIGQRITYQV